MQPAQAIFPDRICLLKCFFYNDYVTIFMFQSVDVATASTTSMLFGSNVETMSFKLSSLFVYLENLRGVIN